MLVYGIPSLIQNSCQVLWTIILDPAFPPLITTTNTALQFLTIGRAQDFYHTPLLDYIKRTKIKEVMLQIERPNSSTADEWKRFDRKIYQLLTLESPRQHFTLGISIFWETIGVCKQVVQAVFPLCTALRIIKCLDNRHAMEARWKENLNAQKETVLRHSLEHYDRWSEIAYD